MRIAVTAWTRRVVGGAEGYLQAVVPALVEAGQEVSFWHEVDIPQSRRPMHWPDIDVRVQSIEELGRIEGLKRLRGWRPDLIYNHGLHDSRLEAELLSVAPVVTFQHGYNGTCISGNKMHAWPRCTPCDRRFGAACLACYFPRRCGGLNPIAMLRLYQAQSERLKVLRRCCAVIVNSQHMFRELQRHDVPARLITFMVDRPAMGDRRTPASALDRTRAWQLLFLGRMDRHKGGRVLLQALPEAVRSLDRSLRLIFAGDGPDRRVWEADAVLARKHANVAVDFVGWIEGRKRDALLSETNLLVVPSLWPEPFGMVGPEAALRGIPVVAFDVGGVREWLHDGVNGHLAPGHPPTASGLASAIVKSLADPSHLETMAGNAPRVAGRFNVTNHLVELLTIFDEVLQHGSPQPSFSTHRE